MNYYQSKKHKQRYKTKGTTIQSYRKISKQNIKKGPGIEIEGAHFNCTGEMGIDNLGCLNSSHFYFVASLQKKIKNLWRTDAYS